MRAVWGSMLLVVMLTLGCRAQPPPVAGPTHIDWVDFVRLGGIEYLAQPSSAGRLLVETDLGPEVARVERRLDGAVTDPAYRPGDGDAAYLDVGTLLYAVRGYRAEFRLAAYRGDRLVLFEADTNPAAGTGSDLLDIAGKVRRIGINSEVDGVTELAAIEDSGQVAELVAMVLEAPVDQNRRDHEGPRYFIALHLEDGTAVTRSYWLDSGELARGIMLPVAFRLAIEQALDRDPTVVPEATVLLPTEPPAPAPTPQAIAPTATLDPSVPTPVPYEQIQATVVARATTSPFPTAVPPSVQPGESSIATGRRDGISLEVRLPKAAYLAGEGGRAIVTLRNESSETMAVVGNESVLLDERGQQPEPWPWEPASWPGYPGAPYVHELAPGDAISATLSFQVPPPEQASAHQYVLWAEARFSRMAPGNQGADNIWLRLEAGPIPLQITLPAAEQRLRATLDVEAGRWRLRVLDAGGHVPSGPLWGILEAVAPDHAGAWPIEEDRPWQVEGNLWSARLVWGNGEMALRAWVAAPGYVTAAVTYTVPAEWDASGRFGASSTRQRFFPTLDAARAALDFPLYQPGRLPPGVVLDGVRVEGETYEGGFWANAHQSYRLPDDAWLGMTQMVTSRPDEHTGWGQARYDFEAQTVTVGQTTGYAIRRFDRWVLDWKLGDAGFELQVPVGAFSLEELIAIGASVQPP